MPKNTPLKPPTCQLLPDMPQPKGQKNLTKLHHSLSRKKKSSNADQESLAQSFNPEDKRRRYSWSSGAPGSTKPGTQSARHRCSSTELVARWSKAMAMTMKKEQTYLEGLLPGCGKLRRLEAFKPIKSK